MTPKTDSTPSALAEAGDCGRSSLATGYAPKVGDRFHKPAGTRISPLDVDPVPTPERNAVVTMVSHSHVVVLIDGKEYTMPTGDFITLAEGSLANGSICTRSA